MIDVSPSLPPYAHLDEQAVVCVAKAARYYDVPELLLHAILTKENGRTGKTSKNKNGSLDIGLAQINTVWLPHFAKYGVKFEHLLNDPCTNLYASAYVLKTNVNKFNGDWFKATVAYNIGPNNWTPGRYKIGYVYARDVTLRWHQLHNHVMQWRRSQGIESSSPGPT
jgi:soluble lytic murein transglycosylase-like protein